MLIANASYSSDSPMLATSVYDALWHAGHLQQTNLAAAVGLVKILFDEAF